VGSASAKDGASRPADASASEASFGDEGDFGVEGGDGGKGGTGGDVVDEEDGVVVALVEEGGAGFGVLEGGVVG
jgi:hypothetical protein